MGHEPHTEPPLWLAILAVPIALFWWLRFNL